MTVGWCSESRRAVTETAVVHVDQRSVIGFKNGPTVDRQDIVGTDSHPIGTKRKDSAPESRAFELAALDWNDAALALRHHTNFHWRTHPPRQGQQKLGAERQWWADLGRIFRHGWVLSSVKIANPVRLEERLDEVRHSKSICDIGLEARFG
jgi:hypothetical protein